MKCEDKFRQIYGKEPSALSFCPYRVCPVGAHSDHQFGKITGFAIDKGIHIAYAPKHNGVVELCSLQFPKRAQWHVRAVPEVKTGDWADYLRGATLELGKRYVLDTGISGVIEGSLPIGGLSSSAAVIIAFLKALCAVNHLKLADSEMIAVAQKAEFKYVGVSCGKLDQSCEVLCRKDHLLYLDTLDDSYELIAKPAAMKPFKFLILFSGVERNLAGSKYNMRVDECVSAAYALKAFSGMEYGKFNETHLREVPREIYEKYKERLPENWRKRAEHWYSEFDRVEKAAEAWRKGDIEEYGRISTESGNSSIYNWETGSPELKCLYELLIKAEGVYGGRFSGAGFKGCCMAIVDPAYAEKAAKSIEEGYLAAFPELRGKFAAYICDSADGVGL